MNILEQQIPEPMCAQTMFNTFNLHFIKGYYLTLKLFALFTRIITHTSESRTSRVWVLCLKIYWDIAWQRVTAEMKSEDVEARSRNISLLTLSQIVCKLSGENVPPS